MFSGVARTRSHSLRRQTKEGGGRGGGGGCPSQRDSSPRRSEPTPKDREVLSSVISVLQITTCFQRYKTHFFFFAIFFFTEPRCQSNSGRKQTPPDRRRRRRRRKRNVRGSWDGKPKAAPRERNADMSPCFPTRVRLSREASKQTGTTTTEAVCWWLWCRWWRCVQ